MVGDFAEAMGFVGDNRDAPFAGTPNEEKPMMFAGIDPGVYSTTVAILDSCCNLISWHQVYSSEEEWPRTPNRDRQRGQRYFDPIPEKIAEDHYKFMKVILASYKLEGISTEKMEWSAKHSDTQGWVHHFRGIIHATCIQTSVPFYMINPQQIKKAVTGKGNAKKDLVVDEIYEKYSDFFPSLSFLKKNNHIADAIGAALSLIYQEIGYIEEEE